MATKNDQYLYDKGYTQEQIDSMRNAIDSGEDVRTVLTSVKPANAPVSSSNNTATPTQTPTETARVEETIRETPVKQQETPISTVSEIKQEGALKPKSQEYYNQTSDEALNTIRDNLNRYKQTNPEYFTDYDSFKKNFSYNARTEEQKTVLDNWYKGYQNGLTLASTPVSDLYTQYQNGDLSSSQIENLRIANPTKYGELQSQINKGNIIAAYDDDKGEENSFDKLRNLWLENMITNLTTAGSESSKIFDVYEERMNSPEMLEISDKTTELQEQIENIQDDIASMTKAVEKEYEGTGATKSKINAIVADRTYDLQLQLRTLNNEYNKYATQYNNRMQQYQQEFTMQLQEYQLGMQERNQKMNELGFAMDLMNYETPQQQEERQWNYWVKQQEYANGDINSKDETARYKAALKSVQNLLSQYEGIPMKRSAEQMAQDIITAISNGSNLGAELTKINQQIQDKPEYKKLYNQTFGGIKGVTTFTVGGQEYAIYDDKIITSDEFNKKFGAVGGANYNVISEDALKTYSDGKAHTFGSFMANPKNADKNYIGECGKFVNNYLQEIGAGRPFGNEDIKTRESWINSDEGKVGTIAIFDYNNYSSDNVNHGHVAIVVSAPDKNGDFWVKDANFGKDGKIQTRKVNIKDSSLKGFLDPSLNQNGIRGATLTMSTNSNGTTTTTTTSLLEPDGMIHLGNTKLSLNQFDEYVKDYIDGKLTYSEIDKLGDGALNKVTERKYELLEQGYEPSTKITDPNKLFSNEQSLKKDYDSLVEGPQSIIDFVSQMETAYNLLDTAPSAAGQSLIYAYNKILDSRSIVREGEYDRAAGGQSLIDEFIGKVERYKNGGPGVTKAELGRYLEMAKALGEVAEQKKMDIANRTKVSIDTYGFNPEAVLGLDMTNKLYGGEEKDYWSEYRSSTPQGTDTINVGNGLSITRP